MQAADRGGYFANHFNNRSILGVILAELGAFEEGLERSRQTVAIAQAHDHAFVATSLAGLAWVYLMRGNLFEAAATLTKARQALERPVSFPSEPALVVLVDGLIALTRREWERADALADAVRSMLAAMHLRIWLPDAGYLKGRALLAQGRRDEARAALEQARAVAEDMGCRRMLWPILFALSQAIADSEERQRWLGQAQATIGYIAEHIGDPQLRASFLNTPPCRRCSRQSMRADGVRNAAPAAAGQSWTCGTTCSAISWSPAISSSANHSLFERGQNLEAQRYITETLTNWRETGEPTGISTALHHLGCIAYALGAYEEVEQLQHETLVIRRANDISIGVAHCFECLGNIAYAQETFAAAEAWYRQSQEIHRNLVHTNHCAWIASLLGKALLAQGRLDEACRGPCGSAGAR